MADYDVGVLALSSPPVAAVRTQYRPAVQVRNNGIHEALASGYLRIYAAGLLIFETEVYSNTLAAGATGLAQAVDYWTPAAEGTYIINGYVTTPLDQVEPNNNLAPVTIIVSGEPVPPPSPVAAHASQHEEGGSDELSIEGLPGRAADPQTPFDHASNHQPGGSDVLDVTGLTGVLATPQTPAIHKTSHQGGGSDELSVAGLQGVLANPQTPKDHATSHILAGADPINPAFLIPQPVTRRSTTSIPAAATTTLLSKVIGAGDFKAGLILHTLTRINWTTATPGQVAALYFTLTPAGHGDEYTGQVIIPVDQIGNTFADLYLHVYESAGEIHAQLIGVAHSSTAAAGADLDVYFAELGVVSGPIPADHQVTAVLTVIAQAGVAGESTYALCEYSGNT